MDPAALDRFRRRRAQPVDTWRTCPICDGPLQHPSEVAVCPHCLMVYTDRGREPIPHDSWSGRTFVEGTRPLERTPDNGHRFMHPLIWSLQADPAQPPEPKIELEIEAYGTLGE